MKIKEMKQQLLREKLQKAAMQRAQNADGTPNHDMQRNIMLNSKASESKASYKQNI